MWINFILPTILIIIGIIVITINMYDELKKEKLLKQYGYEKQVDRVSFDDDEIFYKWKNKTTKTCISENEVLKMQYEVLENWVKAHEKDITQQND